MLCSVHFSQENFWHAPIECSEFFRWCGIWLGFRISQVQSNGSGRVSPGRRETKKAESFRNTNEGWWDAQWNTYQQSTSNLPTPGSIKAQFQSNACLEETTPCKVTKFLDARFHAIPKDVI